MRKIFLVAGLPLLLGGCLPVPLQLASTGLTAFAMVATGKSTTDHVISATVKEDCALYRIALMQLPCRTYAEGEAPLETVNVQTYPGDREEWYAAETVEAIEASEIAEMESVAAGEKPDSVDEAAPPSGGIVPASIGVDRESETPALPLTRPDNGGLATQELLISSYAPSVRVEPIDVDELIRRAGASAETMIDREGPVVSYWYDPNQTPVISEGGEADRVAAAPRDRVPSVAGEVADRYVVLGSFRSLTRAHGLQRKLDDLDTEVRQVTVRGERWNRVVAGPVSLAGARSIQARYRAAHGSESWLVRADAGTASR